MAVTLTISNALYERLKGRASEFEPHEEDFCVDDFAGGNMDDAYWHGVSYAEGELALDLIESHNVHKEYS